MSMPIITPAVVPLEKCGGVYCLHESNAGRVNFPFEPLKDGQRIDVGNVHVDVLHTPGHTSDSICLLVTDRRRMGDPCPGRAWRRSSTPRRQDRGRLSDRIGRMRPIVWGMWLCGGGVAVMPLLDSSAGLGMAGAVSGFGMALLYPNLSAAVADIAHPDWRDFGYAVAALLLGVAAAMTGALEITFWLVGGAMVVSGLAVRFLAEETLPRLSPASS